MNKKQKTEKTTISDLPLSVLAVILSILPIKGILSCKMVCKLWCSIIKDPHFSKSSKFVTMIVRRNGKNRVNKHLHVVEPEIGYTVRRRSGNLCLMLGNNAVIKLNDGGFDGVPVEKLILVNYCKGLVCFISSTAERRRRNKSSNLGPFIVCNPVTSDYVVVKQPISEEMAHSCVQVLGGFGCSSRSGQYKVLRLHYTKKKKDDDGLSRLMADVWTLGSDEEWRRLEHCPSWGCFSSKRTFFGGALHWIMVENYMLTGKSASIVKFDFEEENFGGMDLPNVLNHSLMDMWIPDMMDLAVLHSRLCFCVLTCEKRDRCDIWIMIDYGFKESWTKLFAVTCGENDFRYLMPFKPLISWNNGEILMLSVAKELVSYDPASNKWRAIGVPGVTAKVDAMVLDPIFVPINNLLMQGN